MNSERPIIKVIPTKTDNLVDRLSWVFIAATWIYTIVQYTNLPATIPVHFNIEGKIDNYGSRATIFILPAVLTIVVTGFTFLSRVPHIFNYPYKITPGNALSSYTKSIQLLRILKLIISIFALVITFQIIQSAKAGYSKLQWWFIPLFIGSMIIPIGISLYSLSKSK